MDYVGGYCVCHDVSEREFQLERVGQWTKGKSCDGFGPIGPWLATKEDIPDPQSLAMWLKVNGETMQNGSTRTMVYRRRLSRLLPQPVHELCTPATSSRPARRPVLGSASSRRAT